MNGNGDFLWVKSIGGADSTIGESGRSIAADSVGKVYTLGSFKGAIDFDPGLGIETINCTGNYSLAIIKLDTDGNYIRTRVADGNSYIVGSSLELDNNANLHFTGWFAAGWSIGPIDVDPGPSIFPIITPGGTASGGDAIFIAKWSQCNAGSSNENVASCANYTWNNETYSNSGNYSKVLMNQFGCDSTVNLSLTILNPSYTSESLQLCSGDSVVVGNQVYNQSGAYQNIYTGINGCESIVNVNLTILAPVSFSQSINLCNGESFVINDQVYTKSGVYQNILAGANGCDSIVNTVLNVDTMHAQMAVSELGLSAINFPTDASFLWLDCGNAFDLINGATDETFTPTVEGLYSVLVSNNAGSDTSLCIAFSTIGVASFKEGFDVAIYPNPTRNIVTIEVNNTTGNQTYRLADSMGRQVMSRFIDPQYGDYRNARIVKRSLLLRNTKSY